MADMAVTTLSVSFDSELASVIKELAEKEGLTVSAWLAGAVQDRVRNHYLTLALDADAREFGRMSDEERDRLIAQARARSFWTGPPGADAAGSAA
jgi:predicted transcriptional regulator